MESEEKYIREQINIFKHHINIVNADFLSKHLRIRLRFKDHLVNGMRILTIRFEPCIDADDSFFNRPLKRCPKRIRILNTNRIDGYVLDLLERLTEKWDDSYNNPEHSIDERYRKLNESKLNMPRRILEEYDRTKHINRLVWTLKSFQNKENWSVIDGVARKIFSMENINSDLTYCGLLLEALDYQLKTDIYLRDCVKIKSLDSIFADATPYYNNYNKKTYLHNSKIIEIPPLIKIDNSDNTVCVTELSEGIFENLTDVEMIVLPNTLQCIPWSFWHCKNLKNIIVEPLPKFNGAKIKDIDGVLYDVAGTELIAYPNRHSKIYNIPEGVKKIRSKAFKDCDNIEVLILPKTLEIIEINAFYRCVNLKYIIVKQPEGRIIYKGLTGNHGNVNPKWFWGD